MRTYDVAIVGYGPTGMVLAALMGRQGHSVIVLDRHRGLYNLPRAACFDDEIMRTFQKLGIVDEIMPGTVVQTGYQWVNGEGETLLDMTYDNPARGGWAALYMMYQPHIETVLDRLCASLPTVEVRQGTRILGLEPADDGVNLTATATAGDGDPVAIRARYVVGADGGTGVVRPALGIGFSDYNFQENWLVCDFRKRRPLPSVPTFQQVCDPAQPIAIVQIGPDHHRFSFMLDPDETAERATDAGRVWERVAAYLGPEDADLVRAVNYVFRSRIADRWREGRVMLAGDAAHEMPPFLAQGMCSGMRDSHNLAWKLDLVLTGQAGDEILDTYQPEREPHVRFITEKAIELGRVQTLRDPDAARLRDERLLGLRREQKSPERILYPGLSAGLIDDAVPEAGAVFPQARVEGDGGIVGRFDDLAGEGWCIVARRRESLEEIDGAQAHRWEALGGRTVVVGSAADGQASPGDLIDVDGAYGAWFDAHACEAAVVRPDWYLYGTAADASELATLLDGLSRRLAE